MHCPNEVIMSEQTARGHHGDTASGCLKKRLQLHSHKAQCSAVPRAPSPWNTRVPHQGGQEGKEWAEASRHFLLTASKSWALRQGSFVKSGPWHVPHRAVRGLIRGKMWKCSAWSWATSSPLSLKTFPMHGYTEVETWSSRLSFYWLLEIIFKIRGHTYV